MCSALHVLLLTTDDTALTRWDQLLEKRVTGIVSTAPTSNDCEHSKGISPKSRRGVTACAFLLLHLSKVVMYTDTEKYKRGQQNDMQAAAFFFFNTMFNKLEPSIEEVWRLLF